MTNQELNHRAEVAKLAQLVNNESTYGQDMYAIDVSNWGISEPFSDPENSTFYRSTLDELAHATLVIDNEENENTHYPNASYESIFDY